MKNLNFKTQSNCSQRKLHNLLQQVFSTDHYKIDTAFHTPTHWAQVCKITLDKGALYQPCDRTYIVRVLSLVHSTLEERQKEILLTQTMSELGIAPRMYYGNPYMGVMVMEYVVVKPMEGDISPMTLQVLAHKLKKVHGLDPRPYMSLGQDKLDGLLDRVSNATKSALNPLGSIHAKPSKFTIFEQALKAYGALQKMLDVESMPVLCHLDLNKTNLLWDGSDVWIIDWDMADRGDAYFDLATVINTLRLTPVQEEYFLQTYFERKLNDLQMARLHVVKQMCYLRYALTTFGLCSAYKVLPAPQGLMADLHQPFVFPFTGNPTLSKNMALYRLALAFYKAAKTNMCTSAFTQALQVLNHHQEPIHEHIRSFCND